MSTTSIGWTDLTLNPVIGCTHAGYQGADGKKQAHPGCLNCYAEGMCSRKLPGFTGHNKCSSKGKWTGEIQMLYERLAWPFMRKEYQPRKDGKQRRCFLTSLSDMGHPALAESDWMAVQGMMLLSPWIIWQDLTKRPERQRVLLEKYSPAECVDAFCSAKPGGYAVNGRDWLKDGWRNEWIAYKHIHRYVSVSDQATADALIPELLRMPCAVRGVSLEPMVERVDLLFAAFDGAESLSAMGGINHVIVGGESGRGRGIRPFALEWALDVIEQCKAAKVACFIKQMGSKPYTEDVGRWEWFDADKPIQFTGKGDNPIEWPEALRVQQNVGDV